MAAEERIRDLLRDLSNLSAEDRGGVLAIWERFRREVGESPPPLDEVICGLDSLRQRKEWAEGEAWLVMATAVLDSKLVKPLCDILDLEDPSAPNENIVELLIDLKSPESVLSLSKATAVRYEFDPNLQIPIKAMEALCEVGTTDALEHVESIKTSGDDILSEEAEILLEDS